MNMVTINECKRCGLYTMRRSIVQGRGSVPADVLILGEAPGKSEDALGEAFVGESGILLQKLLQNCKFTYYITNIVMCHPCDSVGGDNREPTAIEVSRCYDNVIEINRIIRPKLVIFLGKISEKYYSKILRPNIMLFHPAFLLRTGGIHSPYFLTVKRKLEEICIH